MESRRISLPSFHEISKSLPKPQAAFHNTTPAPMSIPLSGNRPTHTTGPSSPSSYQPYPPRTTAQDNIHFPHSQHILSGFLGSKQPEKISYELAYGVIMPVHAKQPVGNNVQVVAQMKADHTRQAGIAASMPNTSFMHTPSPPAAAAPMTTTSQYAPYHTENNTHVSMSTSPPNNFNTRAKSNSSRASASNHYIRRSPPPTSQQVLTKAMVSPMQQQRKMQIISQQYANHPISAPASRFTRQEPQNQLPQDHSTSEFIEGDDGDESVMGCYDEMRNSATDNGLDGDGNVMTTAKIRTIHKLAERRRRREMKNLFDMLRKCLPIDKTIRLSKWEVLKKSIEVISSQDTEIHMLRAHIAASSAVPNGSTDINKIFSNSSSSNGSN